MAGITYQKANFTYMIRTYRKTHLLVWICIALLLIVAIVAAYLGSQTVSKWDAI
jgi:quinol-cytochrome oxidoreductase complex cytochrome b subunit